MLCRWDAPSVLVLGVKCLVIVVIWRTLAIPASSAHSTVVSLRAVSSSQPTRRDATFSLRYSVRSLPTCGTMREIIYHWNTLDLARTCCELKLNPERSFLTSRACVRRRSYLKFYSGERKWIFHSVKQRDGRSRYTSLFYFRYRT